MRIGVAIVVALLLAGCSGANPVAPASATESPDVVAKNCADPQWKDKNLGLWYSVCRKPMDW
jgi:PBP1b-binding outer membrane lipoprotein LpoB